MIQTSIILGFIAAAFIATIAAVTALIATATGQKDTVDNGDDDPIYGDWTTTWREREA